MESIVAMVVIMVSLGIAMMIYVNVMSSDKQQTRLKIMLILNNEAKQAQLEKNFIDSEKEISNFVIKKEVVLYGGTENLYHLKLTALDKEGKFIASRNELIITSE